MIHNYQVCAREEINIQSFHRLSFPNSLFTLFIIPVIIINVQFISFDLPTLLFHFVLVFASVLSFLLMKIIRV